VEIIPRRTGNVEERDWWRVGLKLLFRLEPNDRHLCLAQQQTFFRRKTKCCLTRGVKTQKRKELTNPCPESPIPCNNNNKKEKKKFVCSVCLFCLFRSHVILMTFYLIDIWYEQSMSIYEKIKTFAEKLRFHLPTLDYAKHVILSCRNNLMGIAVLLEMDYYFSW